MLDEGQDPKSSLEELKVRAYILCNIFLSGGANTRSHLQLTTYKTHQQHNTKQQAFMPTLGYDLLESEDMPLAIRQHRRLYELIGAHATLWQRRK